MWHGEKGRGATEYKEKSDSVPFHCACNTLAHLDKIEQSHILVCTDQQIEFDILSEKRLLRKSGKSCFRDC